MGPDLKRRRKINTIAKLKLSKVSFVWNQIAFTVPVTVINLTVSRYFSYHDIDHLVSFFMCMVQSMH